MLIEATFFSSEQEAFFSVQKGGKSQQFRKKIGKKKIIILACIYKSKNRSKNPQKLPFNYST
jgi:hypothetical protein